MAPNRVAHLDERAIDDLFAHLDQVQLPGAAVGIAIGGEPVYARGFGLADMEQPVGLSPATRMHVGSITKHFTCLAFMLLCEEGLASAEDSILKHVPELNAVLGPVTMAHLMGHIGGVRDVHEIVYLFSGTERRVSVRGLIDLYKTIDSLNFPPGTGWNYSNGGYVLLSVAIERIADQPLEEVLRDRIFVPSGMASTVLRRSNNDVLPGCAALHTKGRGRHFEKSYLNIESLGEGGVSSSIEDMLHWLVNMDTPAVGSPSIWKAMLRSMTLSSGASTGYALGLSHSKYRGAAIVSHSGLQIGGNAQFIKMKRPDVAAIVIANRDDVSSVSLCYSILDLVVNEPGATEAKPGRIVNGLYRSPSTGRVIQLWGADGAQVLSVNGIDQLVVWGPDGVLQSPPVGRQGRQFVDVSWGAGPEPERLHFHHFGEVDELVPLEPCDARAVPGHYRSNATGTEATVDPTGTRLSFRGRFGATEYDLETLSDGIWRARAANAPLPWGGIVQTAPDKAAFDFSTPRTLRLRFERERRS